MRGMVVRSGLLIAFLAWSFAVGAQTLPEEPPTEPTEAPEDEVTPQQEHSRRVDGTRKISALDGDLFGDTINDYTGSVQFSVTDVSIPGTGAVPVAVSRRFDVDEVRGRGKKRRGHAGSFRDWDMDIPHLHGVFAASTGWQAGAVPGLRCGQANPALAAPPNISIFEADDYWHGNMLYVPGQGDDEVLHLAASAPDRPTDGLAYQWVTKGLWYFSCLSATANGVAGDSFLARDPEGNKYWFNQIVDRPTTNLKKGIDGILVRKEVWILPTKIEDRFGNWVTYTYSPTNHWDLQRIDAKDGRQITLTYWGQAPNGARSFVQSISDGTRTWGYHYIGGIEDARLDLVTMPDQSTLQYNFAAFHEDHADIAFTACGGPPGFIYAPDFVASIVHPSGAIGTFTFNYRRHGRTYVPQNCWTSTHETGDRIPPIFTTLSLTKKEISAPGLAVPSRWQWSYPSLQWGYTSQCSPSCATTKAIYVEQPDGNSVRKIFGVRYGENDGMLLSTDVLDASANSKRSTTIDYRFDPTGQSYLARVGNSIRLYADPGAGVFKPKIRETITQRESVTQPDTTFVRQVKLQSGAYSFDRFARPLVSTLSSSLGYTKQLTQSYFDQTSLWVLHQPATTTIDNIEASRTDYYSATGLPWKEYRFGLRESTKTYYSNGNLHTIEDAQTPITRITTLSDYHRGVPRLIESPDTTELRAMVNDRGEIENVTDALGNKTCYTYDLMGRMTSLTQPSETAANTCDTTAWTATALSFAPDNCPANGCPTYGLPAGHWKQTIATGSGLSTTHYDAFWRPVLTVSEDINQPSTRSFSVKRYDSSGREEFASYPVSELNTVNDKLLGVRTFYDELGRVKRTEADSEPGIGFEQGVLITTTDYLPGHTVRVTDPRGNQTTTSYRAYDVPSYDEPIGIAAPEGVTTTITRDVFGKPLTITRSGPAG